jgi:hypothetical protein
VVALGLGRGSEEVMPFGSFLHAVFDEGSELLYLTTQVR